MSYDVVKPKSVCPVLTDEQKAGLGTVDKLAQVIIPKLVDKLNEANWNIGRLEWEINELKRAAKEPEIGDVRKAIDAKGKAAPKRRASSRAKKEGPALSDIADYDPDRDEWMAKVVAGVQITANVVDAIEDIGPDELSGMYPPEVIRYVNGLSDDVKAAIRARFN